MAVGDTVDWMHVVVRYGGLAVVLLMLVSGCGDTSPTSSAGPSASNQRVLTRDQSQRLVDWAVSLRSCLQEHGFEVGEPNVTSMQINLAVARSTRHQISQAAIGCGDSMGGPPAKSSVMSSPSGIVMYLPKQCLLDPTVQRRSAAKPA
jgi:hypothetical protein